MKKRPKKPQLSRKWVKVCPHGVRGGMGCAPCKARRANVDETINGPRDAATIRELERLDKFIESVAKYEDRIRYSDATHDRIRRFRREAISRRNAVARSGAVQFDTAWEQPLLD